jgi:hypothetical protein
MLHPIEIKANIEGGVGQAPAALGDPYTINVQVNGPSLFDPPVIWSPAQSKKVPVTPTRLMRVTETVELPTVPADKVEIVSNYVKAGAGVAVP